MAFAACALWQLESRTCAGDGRESACIGDRQEASQAAREECTVQESASDAMMDARIDNVRMRYSLDRSRSAGLVTLAAIMQEPAVK